MTDPKFIAMFVLALLFWAALWKLISWASDKFISKGRK